MRNDYYRYIKKKIRIQDICEILGIPVYGQGIRDMCKCPFHDDRTPSMAIYEDHAYCYACNKRWDNLDFIGEQLDLDFEGQIEWMEKHFPEILSQRQKFIKSDEKAIPKSGYEIAYDLYEKMTPEEGKDLQQFADKRQYQKSFLENQGIFFAKGRKLQTFYVQDGDVCIEERTKLGQCQLLLRQPWREKSLTDRYADYYPQDGVIITIRDRKRNIVGFAQRADGERKPKYKFTKELPKRTILYRIDEFEKKIQAEKKVKNLEVYLVEGIFDALRMETEGKNALAVLGSQLTKTQTEELETVLREYSCSVSIHIFMDNDEAGQRGNLQTLRNLWSKEFFRKSYIDIIVPSEGKDPDQIFKKGKDAKRVNYLPFEYLVRSNIPDEEMEEEGIDTKKRFESLGTEERILCLSKIKHWLPEPYWQEILDVYTVVSDDYFIQIINAFVGGRGTEYPQVAKVSMVLSARTGAYQFQTALQIARTSYEREALPLDELSWERIQACADAFFTYFGETLREGNTLRIPLLTIGFPKKLGEERTKSIYAHERLILQQYVLNEMLGEGDNGYTSYIPAVRYNRQNNRIFTTGVSADRDTVSFAYQVDMDVLLGNNVAEHGMFREYYGCWKAYIQYIQEGIQRLNSDRIYRIKLDIRKFYDSIPQYAVRRVAFPALLKALSADPDKFSAFQSGEKERDVNSLAENVTGWLLKELYESRYYDSEDGSVTVKDETAIGIPQGPNLSAYIANIVLFEMDRKVVQLVDEINGSAPQGTIIIRYARYVDDMIIISSNADALLEIKSLISSELHELGLILSPKTDREDGVSKEEALTWTTDQRGGLGVSAVFDFPDDTLDDVLDELESYETTDRRSALKLLESALFAVDKDLFLEETDQNRLLSVLFQTQEIRFADMVRVAELLLTKAARQDGNMDEKSIYDSFIKLWCDGKKSSPGDSLFWEDGIELYLFIEGCNKVLKRKGDSIRAKKRFQIWKMVKEAIGKCWQAEFVRKVMEQLKEKRVLRENQWALRLRVTEIQCRLKAEGLMSGGTCELEGRNVFECRWQYAFWEKDEGLFCKFPSGTAEERIVSLFHSAAFCLSKVSEEREYKEIQSAVLAGAPGIFVQNKAGILGYCLADWFQEQRKVELGEESTRISLLTLLNLLEDSVKAEIIDKLPHYQEYMFHVGKESLKKCLPVVPGVGYPGIIAEIVSVGHGNSIIKRVDFAAMANARPENWEQEEENAYSLCSMALDEGFVALDTLFDDKGQKELQIPLILDVYQRLYKKIQEIQKENPSWSVVLSRKNVFVKRENNSEDFSLLLCFYLLPQTNTGNGVLLDGGRGRFVFHTLHDLGSAYWIAGYLVKDVCHFDALRLEYENEAISEEKADEVKMMEYTFRRLTGESLNFGNTVNNIHSYEKSVDRAIKRTKSFLFMRGCRDIFLEENVAVDSFISQRMRRENYDYRPVECSYYAAVWAKGYLRSRFDALMKLSEKNEVKIMKKHPTDRRVPKAYLVLADYIEGLVDMVNADMKRKDDFLGLQTLACGLRADAVLLQLRMQVLELIESFGIEQRERMKKQKEDLPFAVLELEENQELTVDESPIAEILTCLLDGKNDKRLSKINHIGWLLLLEWILEAESFESKKEMEQFAGGIKKLVHGILKDTEKDGQEFPFEKMNSFFDLWTCAQTNEFFSFCHEIDQKLKIRVDVRHSDFYYQKKGKIHILLDNQHLEKPEYFLTYSKLDNGLIQIEEEEGDSETKIFSQSFRNGKTVGLSVVEVRLGKMLHRAEGQEKAAEKEMRGDDGKPTENGALIEEGQLSEEYDGKPGVGDNSFKEEREEQTKDEGKKTGDRDINGVLGKIREWQTKSWEQRINIFGDYDRIALFQFKTECSYYHPVKEKCKKKGQTGELGYSCHEFRRRKLLEQVLQICGFLHVKILLLPEYSVRPETVEFLWNEVKNKGYQFSIWAGTFRIPYDYKFSKGLFQDLTGKSNLLHAAVLPVIMPGVDKVYCSRIKKYPSIALNEDINPSAVMDDNFKPVAMNHQGNDGCEEYGDARDRVTELICAEMFALSSPGNMISFAEESFRLFCNYTSRCLKFEEYEEKMLKDIQEYGEAISLYRRKGKGNRRPILLVPACTTRAADYYILGQANYLGSGTSMVFCNGAGKLANGGSCFVGQNSWDDEKERKKKSIEMGTANIYHGVSPGIYRQTSDMSGRGGLGRNEQALLVCDLIPDMDKRQPNPESMKHALELVAHIPILEESIYCDDCIKECIHKDKSFLCKKIQEQQTESRKKNFELMEQIYESLEQCKKGRDKAPAQIAGSLIELGEKYQSAWLKERGKQYWEGNRLFPRNGLPETALDWCYIEIDYREFMSSDEYYLAMPAKDNSEAEKSMPEKGKEGDA